MNSGQSVPPSLSLIAQNWLIYLFICFNFLHGIIGPLKSLKVAGPDFFGKIHLSYSGKSTQNGEASKIF